MTTKEYMQIGYIRTSCLSKIQYLIEPLLKTRLYIARSYQDAQKEETGIPWLIFKLRGYRDMKIQWDVFKYKDSFKTVMEKLNQMMNQYNFQDFIVEQLQIVINDKTLNGLIQKHIELPKESTILATFINNPVGFNELDGWDANVVRQINEQSIKNLGFKRGTLDLKELIVFNDGKKLKDLTHLLNNEEIIKQVLRNLDHSIWDVLPEIKKIIDNANKNGNKISHIKPGGIRTYEKIYGSKWKFVKDEGV